LTLAVLLGTGLLGLEQRLPRLEAAPELPRSLEAALATLGASAALRGLLGDPLVDLYLAIKRHEAAQRAACADPWRDWDLPFLVEQA
jgi:glutamine synthetase